MVHDFVRQVVVRRCWFKLEKHRVCSLGFRAGGLGLRVYVLGLRV